MFKEKYTIAQSKSTNKNHQNPQAFKAFVSEKLKKVDLANQHTHAPTGY